MICNGIYLSFEEYAAMWGCDPVYDRGFRQPGDGYLFYNFGSEHNLRTREFLDKFAAAIERTIKQIKAEENEPKDIEQLEELLEHVRSLTPATA